MTRLEQIEAAAEKSEKPHYEDCGDPICCHYDWGFIAGAEWSDANNPWKQLCDEMAEALTLIDGRLVGLRSEEAVRLIKKYEAMKRE